MHTSNPDGPERAIFEASRLLADRLLASHPDQALTYRTLLRHVLGFPEREQRYAALDGVAAAFDDAITG